MMMERNNQTLKSARNLPSASWSVRGRKKDKSLTEIRLSSLPRGKFCCRVLKWFSVSSGLSKLSYSCVKLSIQFLKYILFLVRKAPSKSPFLKCWKDERLAELSVLYLHRLGGVFEKTSIEKTFSSNWHLKD